MDFHFNASMTALNVAKVEQLQTHGNSGPMPFSMATVKACYFNEFYLSKIFSTFEFDLSLIEKSDEYQRIKELGKMVA